MSVIDPKLSALCCSRINPDKVSKYLDQLVAGSCGVTTEALVNARTSDSGLAPLHLAAESGNTPVLELLLSKGGDLDAKSKSGQTALHLAAKGGHEECVKILIRNAADPLVRDAEGKTARDVSHHPNIQRCLIEEGK